MSSGLLLVWEFLCVLFFAVKILWIYLGLKKKQKTKT